jgi:hypothetical protein
VLLCGVNGTVTVMTVIWHMMQGSCCGNRDAVKHCNCCVSGMCGQRVCVQLQRVRIDPAQQPCTCQHYRRTVAAAVAVHV